MTKNNLWFLIVLFVIFSVMIAVLYMNSDEIRKVVNIFVHNTIEHFTISRGENPNDIKLPMNIIELATLNRNEPRAKNNNKKNFCFVGEEGKIRHCVKMGRNDKCMSGDTFTKIDKCINPSLRY